MRLVNINTPTFREFFDRDIPAYGILFHRWDKDEVSYRDLSKRRKKSSTRYKKTIDCCAFMQNRERMITAPFARPAFNVSDFDPSDYHLPASRLRGGAHIGYGLILAASTKAAVASSLRR